jgi:Flp pilus assembly protein CpaB
MAVTPRLSPTPVDRLIALLRPRWAHALAVRRLLAVLLAGLGVTLLLRGDPDAARATVLAAARDLPPGRVLAATDLRTVLRESGTLPTGALRDAKVVAGHTLAAPVRAGELLTDVRLLGPRLAAAATGDTDARIVPISLADRGVADMLREGDRVDVVAPAAGGFPEDTFPENADPDRKKEIPAKPRILAQNAMVVLVSEPDSMARSTAKDRVVMLAMASAAATTVAAESLNSTLTVIFH